MVEIVWRSRAVRHLAELFDYLNQRSPSAAKRYVNGLRKACQTLAAHPEKAPVYRDAYRVLAYKNHLVFYRYESPKARILVVAVFDGRRDIARLVASLARRNE